LSARGTPIQKNVNNIRFQCSHRHKSVLLQKGRAEQTNGFMRVVIWRHSAGSVVKRGTQMQVHGYYYSTVKSITAAKMGSKGFFVDDWSPSYSTM
jgi:hypothetical protein